MDASIINKVTDYLCEHGSITPEEAWLRCSCYRLSAVIYTLRKRGMHIRTDIMDGANQFGRPCRYAKYVLEDAA